LKQCFALTFLKARDKALSTDLFFKLMDEMIHSIFLQKSCTLSYFLPKIIIFMGRYVIWKQAVSPILRHSFVSRFWK
jgi:hypothetical protein